MPRRRFLLLAAVLVLCANLAAVTTGAVDNPPVTPVAVATLPAEDLPPAVPDRLTTTTTTVATTVATSRPVDPPKNAYAEEPQVVIGTIEIPKLGLSVPLNQASRCAPSTAGRVTGRAPRCPVASATPSSPGTA